MLRDVLMPRSLIRLSASHRSLKNMSRRVICLNATCQEAGRDWRQGYSTWEIMGVKRLNYSGINTYPLVMTNSLRDWTWQSYSGFTHKKGWCSIVMLVCQRVNTFTLSLMSLSFLGVKVFTTLPSSKNGHPAASSRFLFPERWISTPQHGRENHCAMLVIKRGIYYSNDMASWYGINMVLYIFFQPSKHI